MLTLTAEDAYAAAFAADRKGDFKGALMLSALLIRGFETGEGMIGFPLDRVGVVCELHAKALKQYTEAHSVLLHQLHNTPNDSIPQDTSS